MSEPDKIALPVRESRQIVTPYAFGVADELLGVSLASPTRRAVAILIDSILVGLLSQLHALVLASLFSVTFFRAGNRLGQNQKYRWARVMLRFFAAVLLFAVVASLAGGIGSSSEVSLSQPETEAVVPEKTDKIPPPASSDPLVLPSGETQVAATADLLAQPVTFSLEFDDSSTTDTDNNAEGSAQATTTVDCPIDEEPSLIAWLKTELDNLGLGFGWAALYFSVFTAWWRGQTPGKKLLGIKVLRLDGSDLNLWDSFGRYGGYGAGFATGLLGFAQVGWDPNRQAIQDKIAETLVIRLENKKAK